MKQIIKTLHWFCKSQDYKYDHCELIFIKNKTILCMSFIIFSRLHCHYMKLWNKCWIQNCIAEFSSKVSSFRVMNIDYKTFALVALLFKYSFKIYFSLFASPKYNGQFKIVNLAENLTELVSQLSSLTWHLKTSK